MYDGIALYNLTDMTKRFYAHENRIFKVCRIAQSSLLFYRSFARNNIR